MTRSSIVAVALACPLAGCAVGTPTLRPLAVNEVPAASRAALLSPKLDQAGVRTLPADSSQCELRLFAEQLPSAKSQGIADHALGTMFVERLPTGSQVVPGVCIKRSGQALELPSTILIARDAAGGPALKRFCRDTQRQFTIVPPIAAPGSEQVRVNACTWDGTFHSTRPFTFTLLTAADARVADYVEAFRIYRNGDLMAAWNYVSDQPAPHKVVISGTMLTTGPLAASQPPHLAAMDLRIIPREVGIAHAVDMEARSDRARFQAKLTTAFSSAGRTLLTPAEQQSFDCLREQLIAASHTIMADVTEQPALRPLPTGCTPLIAAGGGAPLSAAYRDAKHQSPQKLRSLRDGAMMQIAQHRANLTAAIPANAQPLLTTIYVGLMATVPAADQAAVSACISQFGMPGSDIKCFNELRSRQGIGNKLDTLIQTAQVIDQNITVALQTADEATLLATAIYERGREALESPRKQAQIFNAFAQSLATQPDVFEPRRDNPPLIASEQRLEMQYADSVQGFVLAPWHGVPLHVNRDFGTDFSAATAVPMLDVAGLRFQWARSRFADFRMAFGVGYIETTDENDDDQAAALPHVSLGLGTFKLGGGLAIGKDLGDAGDRLRLLVGADLFKLISGSNVEAF